MSVVLVVSLLALTPPSPSLGQGPTLFEDNTQALGPVQPCADTKEGCFSHYTLLVDLDGDGDLDLLFANGGGYFELGQPAPLGAYLNDGAGQFTDINQSSFGGFEGRVRQVSVGDVDNDGDIDIYLPDGYGAQPDALFINNGASPPLFLDEGPSRIGRSSRAGMTRMGDVDRDGDLDIIVGEWGDDPPSSPGTATLLRNDGAGFFEEDIDAIPQNTQDTGTGAADGDLFDADGDFDLDLLLPSRIGDSLLFVNQGDGNFDYAPAALPSQPGPYVYGPSTCDVDGDGDLDIWLDNGSANRRAQLLINNGQGVFADETDQRIPKAHNGRDDDNGIKCADVDQDGDLDAVIASLSGNERVLENDGFGNFRILPLSFPRLKDSTLGLDLGDINGDGRLDAITAQGEGGSFINHVYMGTNRQNIDRKAPTIRALERAPLQGEDGSFSLGVAVSDGVIGDSDAAIHRVYATMSDGSQQDAQFMGGDLYQLTLPSADIPREISEICVEDRRLSASCLLP